MFETADLHGGVSPVRYGLTLLLSVFVHVLTVLILIALPLLFLDALPDAVLTFVLASPKVPAPKSPPPPPPPNDTAISREAAVTRIRAGGFQEPSAIPRGIPLAPQEPPIVGSWGEAGISGSVIGTLPGADSNRGVLEPEIPRPLPPPPVPAARTPVTIGGVVLEARLIRRVEPQYPQLAKMARISGAVILQVTVNEEGEVSEVRVLRGHPLLNDASIEAVRQWKYSPTLLNGEPVPVSATVTVIFSLR